MSRALPAGSKCPKAQQTCRTATVRPKERVLCTSISLYQRVIASAVLFGQLWPHISSLKYTAVLSYIKKHCQLICPRAVKGRGLFLKKKNCKNQRLCLHIQFTAPLENLGGQNPSVRVRVASRTTQEVPESPPTICKGQEPQWHPFEGTEILDCSQGPRLHCQTLALSFLPPAEEPWGQSSPHPGCARQI